MRLTTKRRLTELDKLSRSSERNLYRRLALVRQILRDTKWLAENFDNHITIATAFLQRAHFHVESGFVSLPTMLELYDAFPQSLWERYQYDLKAMLLLRETPQLAVVHTAEEATAIVAVAGYRRRCSAIFSMPAGLSVAEERRRLRRQLAHHQQIIAAIEDRLQELARIERDGRRVRSAHA